MGQPPLSLFIVTNILSPKDSETMPKSAIFKLLELPWDSPTFPSHCCCDRLSRRKLGMFILGYFVIRFVFHIFNGIKFITIIKLIFIFILLFNSCYIHGIIYNTNYRLKFIWHSAISDNFSFPLNILDT